MSQWITEEQTPHLRLSAEAEEVLYSGESEFQKIEVFKSKEYGMMLALDGVFQTSEREEFIYHEMIAHVPLFLHPNPERVLIIGGGDGGVARECVRHDCVKEVTMVEIDGKVVELAKQYLPTISKAMIENNPKLTVKIGDVLDLWQKQKITMMLLSWIALTQLALVKDYLQKSFIRIH